MLVECSGSGGFITLHLSVGMEDSASKAGKQVLALGRNPRFFSRAV